MFRILLNKTPVKVFCTLFRRRLAIAIPAALLVLLLLPLSAFAERPIPTSEVPFAGCQPGSILGVHCLGQGDFRDEGPSSFDVSTGIADQFLEKGCTKLGGDGELVELACGGAVFFIKANEVHLFNGPTFHPSEDQQQPIPTEKVPFVGEGQRNPGPGESTQPPSQSLPSDYSSPTCSGHCAAR